MKSVLLVKKRLGLVEMTSALVNASFSLPEWQAVKMIFFATCLIFNLINFKRLILIVRVNIVLNRTVVVEPRLSDTTFFEPCQVIKIFLYTCVS